MTEKTDSLQNNGTAREHDASKRAENVRDDRCSFLVGPGQKTPLLMPGPWEAAWPPSDKARALALLHDKARKDVTESLHWALETLDGLVGNLPHDRRLAAAYIEARKRLRASEELTTAQGVANAATTSPPRS